MIWNSTKRLTIKSRLYFVVGIMAFLIVLEVVILGFTISALSGVRAFVGGEGLWSKGQKNAAYAISNYVKSYNENDYADFLNFLKVPLGDKRALEAMEKSKLDYKAAYDGFIEGGNHPDDIDGMINLFKNGRHISYIDKAAQIWHKGNDNIDSLVDAANQLRTLIISNTLTTSNAEVLTTRIKLINLELTSLENQFSYTLGEGSRWLEGLVLKILIITAVTVEFTGFIMSFSLSRGIARGISVIVRAAQKIAKGDYSARAEIISRDELGHLAMVFNAMTAKLENQIEILKATELRLETLLKEVNESNQDLKNFAYVVSHDLKSPLRGIITVSNWLKQDNFAQLNEQGRENVELITNRVKRMNDLVDGILEYSRSTINKAEKESVNTFLLVQDILDALQPSPSIEVIIASNLPTVNYEKTKLIQVFQNLISNAIVHSDKEKSVIQIRCIDKATHWQFEIEDNGVGIEEKYFEKIFLIFQTLANKDEINTTGIGLSIVKKIIENHNGEIWLSSTIGKGSVFYFTIPKI